MELPPEVVDAYRVVVALAHQIDELEKQWGSAWNHFVVQCQRHGQSSLEVEKALKKEKAGLVEP